ncbi:MAG: VOC family protein, partial [Candidatus Nitrosocosmicus sp.]
FSGDLYRLVDVSIYFYICVFVYSHFINIEHYRSKNGDVEKDRSKGVVKHAIFSLNGQEFMAI